MSLHVAGGGREGDYARGGRWSPLCLMLNCLFSARISSQYSSKYLDSSCAYSHNSEASLMCLFCATIAALLYPVAAFAAKCIACSLAILGRRSTSCA